MSRDLLATFGRLFPTAGSRWHAALIIVVSAAIPVAEMLVLRFFTTLVLAGADRYAGDPELVMRDIAIFFAAWAVTRGAHHGVRLARVRMLDRRFAKVTTTAVSPSQHSWEWALALELSTMLVSAVQIFAFSVFFLVLDVPTGLVNAVVCAAVVAAISWLYGRQLARQRDYVAAGGAPDRRDIGQRVSGRIVAAELGSVAATGALALVLSVVLWRTMTGHLPGADAIILFLAMRLLYGQVSQLASGGMRFARAQARRESPR